MGFPDGLDVGCEKRQKSRTMPRFVALASERMTFPSTKTGGGCWKSKFGGKIRSSVLDILSLRFCWTSMWKC